MAQVLTAPANNNGRSHDPDDPGGSIGGGGGGGGGDTTVTGGFGGPDVRSHGGTDDLAACRGSFGAALVDLLPMLPMIASVATVFAYVGGPTLGAQLFQNWPLTTGFAATVVVGGIAMFASRQLNTSSELVHPQSYAELRHRADRLKARLHVLAAPGKEPASIAEAMALEEAKAYREALLNGLSRSGPQWVLGTGYLGMYAQVHRAEEALFMVEPTEEVLAAALYDELRVQGSAITDSQGLVARIKAAVQLLRPTVECGQTTQPAGTVSAAGPAQDPTPAQAAAPAAGNGAAPSGDARPDLAPTPTPGFPATGLVPGSPSAMLEARATLREIRRLVNEFRDERREALVRSRCRLLGTTTVTGLITYVLLAFTVNLDGALRAAAGAKAAADAAAGIADSVRIATTTVAVASLAAMGASDLDPGAMRAAKDVADAVIAAAASSAGAAVTEVSDKAVKAAAASAAGETPVYYAVIAATAIYLVGAAVGLFNRLYVESGDDAAGEDYGLSRSRLVLTPILSGLAAVGGVLITAMLTTVVHGEAMMPVRARPIVMQQNGVNLPAGQPPVIPSVGTASRGAAPGDPPQPAPVLGSRSGPAADQDSGVEQRTQIGPADVFNLQGHPFAIVLAAIFGLTPGLFLDRLKRASEQPKADLKSTEAHRLDHAAQ